MDINAPYYAFYESAYSGHPCGRSPLTDREHRRISSLTGIPIRPSNRWRQRSQLNFDQPELSRILTPLRVSGKEAEYQEALALIKKGAERLRENPRADMDGFKPCPKDQEREVRYQRLLERERRVYRAIREGKTIYDSRK